MKLLKMYHIASKHTSNQIANRKNLALKHVFISVLIIITKHEIEVSKKMWPLLIANLFQQFVNE